MHITKKAMTKSSLDISPVSTLRLPTIKLIERIIINPDANPEVIMPLNNDPQICPFPESSIKLLNSFRNLSSRFNALTVFILLKTSETSPCKISF